MFLNLTVCDKTGKLRGTARIRLDFGTEKWSLEAETREVWRNVTLSKEGSFELRPNKVMWLWDKARTAPDKRNPVILWGPPEKEADCRRPPGEGRLFDPKEQSFKEGKVNWAIDTTGKPDLAPIRERFLKIIEEIPFNFAPVYKINFPSGPPATKPAHIKGNVTNCGALPGWVINKLGGSGAPADLSFEHRDSWGIYKINSSMTGWETWSKMLEKKRGQGPGTLWAPYSKGQRPQPGDIYVLWGTTELNLEQPDGTYKKTKIYGFAHVGIIIDATGDTWKTADCGQGEGVGRGFSGCYQRRAFSEAGKLTLLSPTPPAGGRPLSDAGSKDLKGWVNIESLFAGWRP